jgi:hypothetical protein
MVGRHTAPTHADSVLERIAHLVRGLRYGTVEITVHDGRVVQVERKEKFRIGEDGRNRQDAQEHPSIPTGPPEASLSTNQGDTSCRGEHRAATPARGSRPSRSGQP